jgi:hypothetical protein
MREMKTRGDLLSFAISFALIGARTMVRGFWRGLTDEERYAVADRAVLEMKKHGDPWNLNEELPALRTAAEPSRMQGHWMPGSKKESE